MAIYFYTLKDAYGAFSNFSRHAVELDGFTWPTSEHYFQAQKFYDPDYREKIRTTPSPMMAARLGRSRKMPIRPDWEEVKDEIMHKVVLAKFKAHPELKQLLLSTGQEEIIEKTTKDRYWGCGTDGTGKNMLGKILMQVREELREPVQARILAWEGCNNVRDLGGLRTNAGGVTRFGAIVRADTPARLTPAGWSALYAYGIRTIITLRTDGMTEDDLNFTSPYPDIVNIQAAIEDITDAEFVRKWVDTSFWGTPLYFRDTLERWPQKHAAVFSAIAQAQPGGVLFHCIRGYDRTGIISLLLLGFAGVALDEIVTDYELSVDPLREKVLARENSSVRAAIANTLEGFDFEGYLLKGGASPEDLTAVRARLLG